MLPREVPTYLRILQTPQFTFQIGKDRTPMNIHTGLLEGLSAPLYAMISNGCMKESRDGTAVLEDVEPAVFAAFCEFAYIGTYTIPGRPVTSTTKALGNKDTADTRQPSLKRKRDHDEQEYMQLQTEFNYLMTRKHNKRYFHDSNMHQPHLYQNYPDFVFGAKLYVFATKFLITPLRLHALKTLYILLYTPRVLDRERKPIIDMTRYAYDNTGIIDPGGRPFLRDLIMAYVARNIKSLNKNGELLNCCHENAELQLDLLEVILRRK